MRQPWIPESDHAIRDVRGQRLHGACRDGRWADRDRHVLPLSRAGRSNGLVGVVSCRSVTTHGHHVGAAPGTPQVSRAPSSGRRPTVGVRPCPWTAVMESQLSRPCTWCFPAGWSRYSVDGSLSNDDDEQEPDDDRARSNTRPDRRRVDTMPGPGLRSDQAGGAARSPGRRRRVANRRPRTPPRHVGGSGRAGGRRHRRRGRLRDRERRSSAGTGEGQYLAGADPEKALALATPPADRGRLGRQLLKRALADKI